MSNKKCKVDIFFTEEPYNFEDIIKNTKSTYYVYSPTLNTFLEEDSRAYKQLVDLYKNNVNIILCTMDPNIITQENDSEVFKLCKNNFDNGNCVIKEKLPNLFGNTTINNNHDLITHDYIKNSIRIPRESLLSYLNLNSYDKQMEYQLIKILKKIMKTNPNHRGSIELIFTNRFIPICITISDIYQENGICLLDFKLPCTANRTYIKVIKKNDGNTFQYICDSFNSIVFSNPYTNEYNKKYCKKINLD